MAETSATDFPCINCGSDLRYQPGQSSLTCSYCGAENTLVKATGEILEKDFKAALNTELSKGETYEVRRVNCNSCGAKVEFPPDIHAKECPFCAAPLITDTGSIRQIKPSALLPFALTEVAAKKAMAEWLGSLWFAPNGLQKFARKNRALNGIYVPFWTYDADSSSTYSGQRGTHYYETHTRRVEVDGKMVSRQTQVQKTRWHRVLGQVGRGFDDVLVLGTTSLPKALTEDLAPWDLTALRPYRAEYLAGFISESYGIDLEQGFELAKQQMQARIQRDVRFDIGGDDQRIDDIDTAYSQISFKHILLPVWMAAYRFRGKSYQFVINGQSGRVRGARPYSKVKIALAILAGLVLSAGIGLLLSQSG